MTDYPTPLDQTGMTIGDDEGFDASIRRVWHNERWYFSVVDVIGALTGSPNAGAYWRKLKQRMKEDEGAHGTVTNCHELRMTAADGKQRLTDAADAQSLLRIIQSVPSPKAEPVKRWLARVGAERLAELSDPSLAVDRARQFDAARGTVRTGSRSACKVLSSARS